MSFRFAAWTLGGANWSWQVPEKQYIASRTDRLAEDDPIIVPGDPEPEALGTSTRSLSAVVVA